MGELELGTAHPLCTLHVKHPGDDLAQLAPLVRQWRPVLLVVGMPVAPEGAQHPKARRCQGFGRRLAAAFSLPVDWVDEQYTSAQAETLLTPQVRDWKARKQHLDALAAQQILESYFDQLASRS